MVTDNSPQNYIYFSERIMENLLNQSRGAGPAWSMNKIHLDPKVMGRIEFEKGEVGKNPYAQARAVTEAVRDHTGTVENPGEYLRLQTTFRCSVLPVLSPRAEVAWVDGEAQLPNNKQALIALCGSLHNYVDYDANASSEHSGWYPSTMFGLEDIITAFSGEPVEVTVPALLADGIINDEILDSAYAVYSTLDKSRVLVRDNFDCLARVFHVIDDMRPRGFPFDRLILGAPIWMATPLPAPSSFDQQRALSDSIKNDAIDQSRGTLGRRMLSNLWRR